MGQLEETLFHNRLSSKYRLGLLTLSEESVVSRTKAASPLNQSISFQYNLPVIFKVHLFPRNSMPGFLLSTIPTINLLDPDVPAAAAAVSVLLSVSGSDLLPLNPMPVELLRLRTVLHPYHLLCHVNQMTSN